MKGQVRKTRGIELEICHTKSKRTSVNHALWWYAGHYLAQGRKVFVNGRRAYNWTHLRLLAWWYTPHGWPYLHVGLEYDRWDHTLDTYDHTPSTLITGITVGLGWKGYEVTIHDPAVGNVCADGLTSEGAAEFVGGYTTALERLEEATETIHCKSCLATIADMQVNGTCEDCVQVLQVQHNAPRRHAEEVQA